MTYTQWEAYLAIYHRNPVHIYVAAADAPCDEAGGDRDEERLQIAHRNRLDSLGRDRGEFANQERLSSRILRDLQDILPSSSQSQPQIAPHVVSLPPAQHRQHFMGRDQDLENLKSHLMANRPQGSSCALVGLGGIGKTRLAIEYARGSIDQYRAILFVGAQATSTMRGGLAMLSGPTILNLPEAESTQETLQYDAVLRWFTDHEDWLLILDNADSEDVAQAVEDLLPKLGRGDVVVTSRLTLWSGIDIVHPLDVIDREASIELLLRRTNPAGGHLGRRAGEDEAPLAAALAERLGYLPLALEQAAAFINRKRYSLQQYLEALDGYHNEVLAWLDQRTMKYSSSVATTWLTTIECLGQAERSILRLAAFMSPEPIPAELFSKGSPLLERATDMFAQELGSAAETEMDPHEGLAVLANYSMITWPDSSFQVHNLVQEVERLRVPPEQRPDWVKIIDKLIVEHGGENPFNPANWPIWDELRPHAEQVWQHTLRDGNQDTFELGRRISSLLFGKGLYKESLHIDSQILPIIENTLDPDDPELAHFLVDYGESCRVCGKKKEAEALFRRAIAIEEKALPNTSQLANSLNYLGLSLKDQGDLEGAEGWYRRSIDILDSLEKPKPHHLCITLQNLGKLLLQTNRIEEAELHLKRAVDIGEGGDGSPDPYLCIALSHLVHVMIKQGRLPEAESYARRELTLVTSQYGEQHHFVDRANKDLATVQEKANKSGR